MIQDPNFLPPQQALPLKHIAMFIQGHKMTMDTSPSIRFATHQHEAQQLFYAHKILNLDPFDSVDWKIVNPTLHHVPKLFQLFACKQVFNIAAVFKNLSHQKQYTHLTPYCPCCTIAIKDCGHVLTCPEVGRDRNLCCQADMFEEWLRKVGSRERLTSAIMQYIKGLGRITLEEIFIETFPDGMAFANSQDNIGWRRFMKAWSPLSYVR
jgi:hypothetical protein